MKLIVVVDLQNEFLGWQPKNIQRELPEKILNYVKPLDLYKYKLNPDKASDYLDYLEFAKELGFDIKDKKYLYLNSGFKKSLRPFTDTIISIIFFFVTISLSIDHSINESLRSPKRS